MLKISEQTVGPILVLELSGQFDYRSTGDFDTQINRFIDAGNHNILLGFSHLEYVCSAGVRSMLAAHRRLEPLGGRIVLFGENPLVQDIFKISGLNKILKVCPDQENALKAVQAS
mgnify:CR=1 FL=1